jgi:three-Cys-motif partner protein
VSRRAWGFWTTNKLDILGDYLPAFNRASSIRAGKTVYLDLFAGAADNEERNTGRPILGSARLALEANPSFTKLYFFDLPGTATTLNASLRQRYPTQDFQVVPGDSNDTIATALADIRRSGLAWAPIFAFLDPYNLGIQWRTLETLADFKRDRKYKVELWVLCFSSTIPRTLTIDDVPDPQGAQRVTEFFGTGQWTAIREARVRGELSPRDAREEYVNLLRWRLEDVLGYRYTLSFEVRNVRGPLYHLVFATDNDAGFKIMGDLYQKAAQNHKAMRIEHQERERQERQPQGSLFSPQEVAAMHGPVAYMHTRPWPPFGAEA